MNAWIEHDALIECCVCACVCVGVFMGKMSDPSEALETLYECLDRARCVE
jgi:hypothetical protein